MARRASSFLVLTCLAASPALAEEAKRVEDPEIVVTGQGLIRSALLAAPACLGLRAARGAATPAAGWAPERSVRIIIPVAPGGSLDILGRTLARHLAPALGQVVVAENHPGAGSNLAFELGFDDPAYFCRFFKRGMGVSPSAFRAGAAR